MANVAEVNHVTWVSDNNNTTVYKLL